MSTPACSCCPPGSWPQLLTTTNADLNQEDCLPPKGTVLTIPVEGQKDLPVYLSEPTGTPKGTILVVPDIYSVRVLNPECRSGDRIGSICDGLADAGYLVALAGIFRDKPFDLAIRGPEDKDFLQFDCFAQDGGPDWFKSNGYDNVGPCIKATAALLNEKAPTVDKPMMGGFCFGTWALCKASAVGDVEFKAGILAHPTTMLETVVFGNDEAAMMSALHQPTSFLWAGNDHPSYSGEGANRQAVEATGGTVYEFPDMLHGWVSRGDVAQDAVKEGVEKALTIMKEFYDSHA